MDHKLQTETIEAAAIPAATDKRAVLGTLVLLVGLLVLLIGIRGVSGF